MTVLSEEVKIEIIHGLQPRHNLVPFPTILCIPHMHSLKSLTVSYSGQTNNKTIPSKGWWYEILTYLLLLSF